jgi:hypothetical protein
MLPLSPRAKKILSVATVEAKALGNANTNTHHVLLAMMQETGSVVTKVLHKFSYDRVKTAVRSMPGNDLEGCSEEEPKVVAKVHGQKVITSFKATSLWIKDKQILKKNVIPGLLLKDDGDPSKVPHLMGVDIGLKEDGSAIAICHLVKDPAGIKDLIELDYIGTRYAKKEGREYFRPDDIADWIVSLTEKFSIESGIMDIYYGLSVVPVLIDKDTKQIGTTQFNRKLHSDIYKNLMSKMTDGCLRIPENAHGLISELLDLRVRTYSKQIIEVTAGEAVDGHDDASDAFAMAVHLTTEYERKKI